MTESKDNSVLFSLRELISIEEQRVRDDEKAKQQAILDAKKREEDRALRAREEEQARVRAAEQARLDDEKRQRDEAEASERARVEAELAIRLKAENEVRLRTRDAELEHERRMAEIQTAKRTSGKSVGLIVALSCLFVGGAGVGAYYGYVKPQHEQARIAAENAQRQSDLAAKQVRDAHETLAATQGDLTRARTILETMQDRLNHPAPVVVAPPPVVAAVKPPVTPAKPPVRVRTRPPTPPTTHSIFDPPSGHGTSPLDR